MTVAKSDPAPASNGQTEDIKSVKEMAVGNGAVPTEAHFKDWPNDAGFNASAEARERVELPVNGKFPSYVAGSLFRTGPGFHKMPTTDGKEFACSHWFDGFITTYKFDMVSSVENEMKVYLTARQQEDLLIERARKTGRLNGITFGQKRDPCDTFWKKFKQTFEPAVERSAELSNIGVTVRTVPGDASKMVAATDNASTKTFNTTTLEPIGVADQKPLHPSLKGPLSGAHAQFDPETGDCFNYNLDFGSSAAYRIFRTDTLGKTDILATITGMKPAYIHSMFLSQNFVILCIWPQYITGKGLSILWERNILDAMKFDPSAQCDWLVVDRRSNRGLVKQFKSPAMFAFHTINAWEETREGRQVDIFCEVAKLDNSDVLHRFYYENMTSLAPNVANFNQNCPEAASLARFKLAQVPLSGTSKSRGTAEVVKQIESKKSGELPTINPKFATVKHRYVYGVADRGRSSFVDGLVKTDTVEDDCIYWERPKHTPGEPIFVPNPAGTDEDDGVLLSVILDGEKGTSYLLCLDAKNMSEIAWAEWDHAVGLGFHGLHVSAHS